MGYPVGDYLAICRISFSEGWGIYKRTSKRHGSGLAVQFCFSDQQEVMRFAAHLNTIFENFLPIYESDPTLNPFELARWTSETHLRAYCLIDILEQDSNGQITFQEIKEVQGSGKIEKDILWWTRGQNWESSVSGHLGVI